MSAYVCAIVRRIIPKAGESLTEAWERMMADEPSATLFATGVLSCPARYIEDPDFDANVFAGLRPLSPVEDWRPLPHVEDESVIPSEQVEKIIDELGHLDIDPKTADTKALRDDAERLARLADLIEGGLDLTEDNAR